MKNRLLQFIFNRLFSLILQFYLKILLFLKNNLLIIKAHQLKAKGLESLGSPYWKRLELLKRIWQ